MWIGEMIDQKEQRHAAGPVRHGHLQVFEGGKITAGLYARPISLWRGVSRWVARRHRPLRLCEKLHQ